MKRLLTALLVAAPAVLLASCTSCPFCSDDGAAAEVVACDDCGVEKGAAGCCNPEAPRCGDCDEVKGSADCCK